MDAAAQSKVDKLNQAIALLRQARVLVQSAL